MHTNTHLHLQGRYEMSGRIETDGHAGEALVVA
jgi:hypothetical protein